MTVASIDGKQTPPKPSARAAAGHARDRAAAAGQRSVASPRPDLGRPEDRPRSRRSSIARERESSETRGLYVVGGRRACCSSADLSPRWYRATPPTRRATSCASNARATRPAASDRASRRCARAPISTDARDERSRFAIISDVSYGIGLVAVGVGAYFLYKGARERHDYRRRLRSHRRMAACSSRRSSRGEVACRPRARCGGVRRVHAVRRRSARRLVRRRYRLLSRARRDVRRSSLQGRDRRDAGVDAHEARDRSRCFVSGTAYAAARRGPNGISARGVGMGGAWTAFADDPTAICFNPAALDDLDSQVMVGGEFVVRPALVHAASPPTARAARRRTRPSSRRYRVRHGRPLHRRRRSTVAVHARLRRLEHVRRSAQLHKTGMPALDATRDIVFEADVAAALHVSDRFAVGARRSARHRPVSCRVDA